MQEECKYGEKCLRLDCKYFHNIRKRSVPCVHFQNKGCFKGDRCPYMHIPKTLGRPAESQINIDIAPVIPSEITLPSKRLPLDTIEPNKEFPEDISAIIDQFEEVPPTIQTSLLPLVDEKAKTLDQVVEISELSDPKPKSPANDPRPFEIQEKSNQIPSESGENDIISFKKSPQPAEKTPELKPSENPEIVDRTAFISNTIEISLPEPAQVEGKINDSAINEEKTKPIQPKPSEIKLVESKSAEVKITDAKPPKGPENVQKTQKVPEGPPKIHQSGKNMIERTVKANRIEETVSLRPLERKKTPIEGATRILTLEEIKEKKRMEALMKEQELQGKEPENSSKVTQSQKALGKPEEKPEEKPLNVKLPEERGKNIIITPQPPLKISESASAKLNEIVSLPAKVNEIVSLPMMQSEKVSLSVKPNETVILPVKPNETVNLPVKRPVSNQVPAPLKQPKLNKFPILVTGKEWEPYKQALKSLDFSEFSLSPEDVQECRKLAEVLSSPEGISKVIFDLEQKLLNYPEIPVDAEFDSLTLTEKIEKMYQEMFKVN